MNIYFQDPNEIRLPPDQVRIRELSTLPSPDGQRVKVYLEVDPFQKRPNADLVISNTDGQEIAMTSIIQSPSRKMELTMHLRTEKLAGIFTLGAVIYYLPEVPEKIGDHESIGQEENGILPDLSARVVADQREVQFEI
jgi:hypothetical protein